MIILPEQLINEQKKIQNTSSRKVKTAWLSWVLNSITKEITEGLMFCCMAWEIWEAAKETYYDNENTAELFEIKEFLSDLQQGDMTVTQHFNNLNKYWK